MPNNASAAQRSGGAQSHNALGLFALAAGAFVLGAAEFVMMGILPQTAQTMHVSIPFAGNFISAYAIGVLFALAAGAFVLGAAEFVMMGILPQTAQTMHVSIPFAGNFISAYAIGVCVGTLILVFGRRIPPRTLIIIFMVIALAGNALSAVSVNAPMLIAARFIAGFPHGAFFGTATLIAKLLAQKGKEARAVSAMVTGQTVANMLGVPAGTLLAEHMTWRLAFCLLAGSSSCSAAGFRRAHSSSSSCSSRSPATR